MFVILVPAVNDSVSEWLHGLDPDHGSWLKKSGSTVSKGEPVFEQHYWDFYRSRSAQFFSGLFGLSKEVRVKLCSPAHGEIKCRDFFSAQVRRYRDYSTAPSFTDAESIRQYSPVLTIYSNQPFTGSAITFYQPWFDAIESNMPFLDSVMRKSQTFSLMTNAGRPENEWMQLLNKERDYFLKYQCPVFEKAEYDKIMAR